MNFHIGYAYASHAHPGGWWQIFSIEIQEFPQASPFLQTLQHPVGFLLVSLLAVFVAALALKIPTCMEIAVPVSLGFGSFSKLYV